LDQISICLEYLIRSFSQPQKSVEKYVILGCSVRNLQFETVFKIKTKPKVTKT